MADSYQVDAWDPADGILVDDWTWQRPGIAKQLQATGVSIHHFTASADLTALPAVVGFSLNPQGNDPFVQTVLAHGWPLMTALDTLLTLIQTQLVGVK